MSNNVDVSFMELRCKEVIDVIDGRNLGHINDVIFSSDSAKVKGFVAPYSKKGLFAKGQEIFIPWNCVKSIGEDVIIVDISPSGCKDKNINPCKIKCQPEEKPPENEISCAPICDKRCDKCMLYDCQFRWKGKVS